MAHDDDDLAVLALSREKFKADADDFHLALSTLEARRKIKGKVPEWHALPSLHYPIRLSAEQCSSSETARYKGAVAASLGGKRIADLTGGLGVDCWAFSLIFQEVLYNDMNPSLAKAARHNFPLLGAHNIMVRNMMLEEGKLADVLDGFSPDVIFLDPARRDSEGRKVFRLEDCSPNVLTLLPELFGACPRLLLKLSPMADISLLKKQLPLIREIHIVALDGECKELLFLLDKNWEDSPSTIIYENGKTLCVDKGCTGSPQIGQNERNYLFEPGKALLKSGEFLLPTLRFGLEKLSTSTHLFYAAAPVKALEGFGKWFRIKEILPLNNRNMKELGKRLGRAEVSARNIPLSSEQLRAKLGVASGGEAHVFGVKSGEERLLIVGIPQEIINFTE